MGQKTNAVGFRLQTNKDWKSQWYDEGDDYVHALHQDLAIREYIEKELKAASVVRVEIKRTGKEVDIDLYVARPGLVIGKGGKRIQGIKDKVKEILDKDVKLSINVKQVKKTAVSARLMAEEIAQQLERRVAYKRAVSRILERAMGSSQVLGIQVALSGRLNGVPIARTEKWSEGKVPLQTIDADIDYAQVDAQTNYGLIGVKVWLNRKGDRIYA